MVPTTGGYRHVMTQPPVIATGRVGTARAAAAASPQHSAVYSPWAANTEEAIARIKAEMTLALNGLQARTAAAGRLLDAAYSTAAGPVGQMRAAALTAYLNWMTAADNLASSIIEPAVEAYDREIEAATKAYDAAIADARKTYESILASANTAKNQANALPKSA